ncbi:hypothetical protein F1649_22440 [Arcticibacter tournemirensis]|uniref:Uncharacterized protein n=1 Tax=Arcticibacter tournemirensis TaxID=699437 RepID=A0A5M9GML4_9SPHI|nr:hypothetical protein [Arcticibacter tournemirensis]KAA8474034.1 hypothetical protein F1649_22440 [Arcticibacter tournemirensis]
MNNNIKKVYVLFKDTSWNHYEGYKLHDGATVKWDKKYDHVKKTLNDYKDKIQELPQESSNYMQHFLLNKKAVKYTPIKTVPLKEFGFLETNSNDLTFYGIIGDSVLIDLSRGRIYY